jgi:hypothetical protein
MTRRTAAATEDIKAGIAGAQSPTASGISDIPPNIGEASMGELDSSLRMSQSSQATQDIARETAGVDHAARQDGGQQW